MSNKLFVAAHIAFLGWLLICFVPALQPQNKFELAMVAFFTPISGLNAALAFWLRFGNYWKVSK